MTFRLEDATDVSHDGEPAIIDIAARQSADSHPSRTCRSFAAATRPVLHDLFDLCDCRSYYFAARPKLRCDQRGRTVLFGRYRLNTNSMEALELCLSSGENVMTFKDCFDPASTAIYCFPLIAKLIGGALMPVPMLKLHTSCKVLASWAEKVPSGCPMNTRLPAVASAPE